MQLAARGFAQTFSFTGDAREGLQPVVLYRDATSWQTTDPVDQTVTLATPDPTDHLADTAIDITVSSAALTWFGPGTVGLPHRSHWRLAGRHRTHQRPPERRRRNTAVPIHPDRQPDHPHRRGRHYPRPTRRPGRRRRRDRQRTVRRDLLLPRPRRPHRRQSHHRAGHHPRLGRLPPPADDHRGESSRPTDQLRAPLPATSASPPAHPPRRPHPPTRQPPLRRPPPTGQRHGPKVAAHRAAPRLQRVAAGVLLLAGLILGVRSRRRRPPASPSMPSPRRAYHGHPHRSHGAPPIGPPPRLRSHHRPSHPDRPSRRPRRRACSKSRPPRQLPPRAPSRSRSSARPGSSDGPPMRRHRASRS